MIKLVLIFIFRNVLMPTHDFDHTMQTISPTSHLTNFKNIVFLLGFFFYSMLLITYLFSFWVYNHLQLLQIATANDFWPHYEFSRYVAKFITNSIQSSGGKSWSWTRYHPHSIPYSLSFCLSSATPNYKQFRYLRINKYLIFWYDVL